VAKPPPKSGSRCRETGSPMSRTTQFEGLQQDLRYGVRTMLKNPGFSAAVVLTIALGSGANTAMFSVIRAALLKPLASRHPDRAVLVADEVARFGSRN
jgi:putative ABC transport system permease protein